MPYVMSVAQQKGGVGKTTLAICIAGELQRRGVDVHLVDADPQRSACHWAELGHLPFNVWEISHEPGKTLAWREALSDIPAQFLMIDSAPNAEAVAASVAVSHLVVVPCTPSGLDIEATKRTLEMVREVERSAGRRIGRLLVPNRVDFRTLEGRQFVDELRALGEIVGPPVGDRTAFVRAFSSGQTIHEFASGSPADHEIQNLCSIITLGRFFK